MQNTRANSVPQKTHSFPESFTPEKKEELFHEIVQLHTLVVKTLETMERNDIVNREAQLELATPFVTQVTNSANILSAFYNEIVNKGKPLTPDVQDTMESAFRNIFYAYKEFVAHAEAMFPAGGADGSSSQRPARKYIDAIGKNRAGAINEPAPGEKKSLEQKFLDRPVKGTLQQKIAQLSEGLTPQEGKLLMEQVAVIGRHSAQLAIELLQHAPGIIRDYDSAVPALGSMAKVARKRAEKVGMVVIDPALTRIERLE